jgi:hypothetical protein
MSYFTYQISPIDIGWEHLRSVEETALEIADTDVRERIRDEQFNFAYPPLDSFLSRWDAAKHAAKGAGWEGDFIQGPCVFWMPTNDGMDFGFVFKQQNNGTTFVMAPVEMPHLE